MTIKDRFLDYWNTDIRYQDYKYDLSIFEMMIYAVFGVIGVIGLVVSIPFWCTPYLIYKAIKIKFL